MNKKMIAAVVVLAVTILACSTTSVIPTTAPTNVPPVIVQPTREVPPTAVPEQNIIFTDDFTDTTTGWEVGEFQDGNIGYGDGFYFVLATATATNMYGLSPLTLSDTEIKVDAFLYSGPTTSGYGIVCRMQMGDNQGDGYYFRVSDDGMYSVLLGKDGSLTSMLSGDKWHANKAIKTDNASNRIVVTCDGDHLKLAANGTTLWETTDSTFSSGAIALMAITYEDGAAAEVHFKDFVVTEP